MVPDLALSTSIYSDQHKCKYNNINLYGTMFFTGQIIKADYIDPTHAKLQVYRYFENWVDNFTCISSIFGV